MQTREPVKTAIFVALWLAAASLIVWSSPSFQSCVGEHYQSESSQALQKGATQFLVMFKVGLGCSGEFVHKNAEAIIALFTIILGIATWLLWRATDKLVKGAEETSKRQLRAYLNVMHATLLMDQVDQRGPGFKIVGRNFGQTPAYDVKVWAAIAVTAFPMSAAGIEQFENHATPDMKERLFPFVVGPRVKLTQDGYVGTPWSITDINAFYGGTIAVYVIGQIKYRDAFGDDQTTDFNVYIGGDALPGSLRMTPAGWGNDAT